MFCRLLRARRRSGDLMGELRESDPDAVTEIWGRAEKEFIRWLSKQGLSHVSITSD